MHRFSTPIKGNNEFHAKRFEAALAQYSAGLAVKFDDDAFRAILHANRAAALQAMRLFCDAVMDCCAAELLDATYVRALQRRADAYLSMGDWSSAVKDLEALAPHMGSECTAKLMEARRKVRRRELDPSLKAPSFHMLILEKDNSAFNLNLVVLWLAALQRGEEGRVREPLRRAGAARASHPRGGQDGVPPAGAEAPPGQGAQAGAAPRRGEPLQARRAGVRDAVRRRAAPPLRLLARRRALPPVVLAPRVEVHTRGSSGTR